MKVAHDEQQSEGDGWLRGRPSPYRRLRTSWMAFSVSTPVGAMREKQEFREFLDNVESFYAAELGVWLWQEDE